MIRSLTNRMLQLWVRGVGGTAVMQVPQTAFMWTLFEQLRSRLNGERDAHVLVSFVAGAGGGAGTDLFFRPAKVLQG